MEVLAALLYGSYTANLMDGNKLFPKRRLFVLRPGTAYSEASLFVLPLAEAATFTQGCYVYAASAEGEFPASPQFEFTLQLFLS
jgi:hypothetical protein